MSGWLRSCLHPTIEGEDKHVESRLIPRLDESSNLSISTKATENQWSFLFMDQIRK